MMREDDFPTLSENECVMVDDINRFVDQQIITADITSESPSR
jgi:hypothetical protein